MLEVAVPTLQQEDAPKVSAPDHRGKGVLSWVIGSLPTLLILLALGGLAAWGHHTGWTMPKLSDLTGNGEAPKDDWCEEHGVPDSICLECNPENGKKYGWCKRHGIHECPLCHPEVAQLKEPPQITPADLDRAQRALAFTDRPENNSACRKHLTKIQFANQKAVEKAGVQVDTAWPAAMTEAVSANGEIEYDQTRLAHLSARVPGTVWQVYKQQGDQAKKGDILALVDAVEVGRAKANLLQALAQVELKSKVYENMLTASGAIPGRALQEAEAEVRAARIRLLSSQQALINLGLPVDADALKGLPEHQLIESVQFLGLPDSISARLDRKTTTANLIPVRASLDGIVVSRDVVEGEVVDSGKVLFTVADTSQMWLNLEVPLEDEKLLRMGQLVRFRPDGSKQHAQGKITWISTEVDEKTRTVKVRVDLANPEGRLRAQTFGTGQIVLREEPKAIAVPNEAVHWEGDCYVVFVRDKNFLQKGALKVFHVRNVRPGVRNETHTEIMAGLLKGEVVAAKGSGALRSQLLRNNLGAG